MDADENPHVHETATWDLERSDAAVTVEPVVGPPAVTLHLPMSVQRAARLLETVDELWPNAYVYPGDDDTELHVIPKE